ncbi:FAD-dependent oxidoreductase [Kumtagia ephedrae]|uniref:SGNH hydrolase-type esterase domain-containing protein n=1 Tax=Kumtagia ephedrae TaxID=2116701 RepID=A0A2P7SPW5_9HYPH|nr:FAD-dependent oxidoreductase [Mesorhizobium ephedrae]PSJ64512.1 hypothetical protein C7I84_06100 [Mesorhizobium ephedrae]
MGQFTDLIGHAWRKYETPGVPSSGPHDPKKDDIIPIGPALDEAIEAAAAGEVVMEVWDGGLEDIEGTREGQPGYVKPTDLGTHTDPVVGGTVPNSGSFRWSTAPAGWKRIGDYFAAAIENIEGLPAALDAKADVTALEAKADVIALEAEEAARLAGDLANADAIDQEVEDRSALIDMVDDGDGEAVVDEDGFIVFRRYSSGDIELPGEERFVADVPGYAEVVVDEDGYILEGIPSVSEPAEGVLPASTLNLEKLDRTRLLTGMIRRGRPEQLRVAIIGDSFTDGEGRYARALAQHLIATYGDAGGGWTGFTWNATLSHGNVRRGDPTNPYTVSQPQSSGGWTANFLTGNGPDLGSIQTSTAGSVVSFGGPASPQLSRVALMYDAQAAASIRYRYNAGSWHTVALDATGGPKSVNLPNGMPTSGAWTCDVEHVSGTSRLQGALLESAATGARVSKWGVNGSSALEWSQANGANFTQALGLHGLDLIIVMLGTNDQNTGQSAAQYLASMTTLLTRLRAAQPVADILVVMPPENFDPDRYLVNPMPLYAKAMAGYCRQHGLPFIDLQPYFPDWPDYKSDGPFPLWNPDLTHVGDANDAQPGGSMFVEVISRAIGQVDGLQSALDAKVGSAELAAVASDLGDEVTDRQGLINNVANAIIPGVGPMAEVWTGPTDRVAGGIREADGRTVVIGRNGELGAVPTEEDLPTYVERLEVPGFEGDAAEVTIDPASGRIAELLRASDGRRYVLGRGGALGPVPTEDDLLIQPADDEVRFPGAAAASRVTSYDIGEDGGERAFVDGNGRRWVRYEGGGIFVPDGAPRYDVLIYGSGAAALCAARRAKDFGLSVVIVVPEDRLGGMMSGGISIVDTGTGGGSTTFGYLAITGGYAQAMLHEINGYYGGTGSPRQYQQRVAQAVCNRWGKDYADRVILDSPIVDRWQSLIIQDRRIAGVATREGPVHCKIAIDASYTGDLLRASGASWTSTREASSADEPLAGFNLPGANYQPGLDLLAAATAMGLGDVPEEAYAYNDIQHIADTSGLPANGTAQAAQMAFNVRSEITDAADRIPFSVYKSDEYDRIHFIPALADAVAEGTATIGTIIALQDGANLPKVEGGGAQLYNTNAGLIGTHTLPHLYNYAAGRWSERRALHKKQMAKHVDFFHFFATDPAVETMIPGLQAAVNAFGWDPREWADSPWYDGLPQMIYERQTIRLVIDDPMTKADVMVPHDDPAAPDDPIGIFSYGLDTKPCNYFGLDAEGDGSNVTLISEGYESGIATANYAIPMRVMLPRRSEVKNLICAWPVAVTHNVWKSLRMEPSGGMMGEAAGCIAALAINAGRAAVQDVPYADVRAALLSRGSILPAV